MAAPAACGAIFVGECSALRQCRCPANGRSSHRKTLTLVVFASPWPLAFSILLQETRVEVSQLTKDTLTLRGRSQQRLKFEVREMQPNVLRGSPVAQSDQPKVTFAGS